MFHFCLMIAQLDDTCCFKEYNLKSHPFALPAQMWLLKHVWEEHDAPADQIVLGAMDFALGVYLETWHHNNLRSQKPFLFSSSDKNECWKDQGFCIACVEQTLGISWPSCPNSNVWLSCWHSQPSQFLINLCLPKLCLERWCQVSWLSLEKAQVHDVYMEDVTCPYPNAKVHGINSMYWLVVHTNVSWEVPAVESVINHGWQHLKQQIVLALLASQQACSAVGLFWWWSTAELCCAWKHQGASLQGIPKHLSVVDWWEFQSCQTSATDHIRLWEWTTCWWNSGAGQVVWWQPVNSWHAKVVVVGHARTTFAKTICLEIKEQGQANMAVFCNSSREYMQKLNFKRPDQYDCIATSSDHSPWFNSCCSWPGW